MMFCKKDVEKNDFLSNLQKVPFSSKIRHKYSYNLLDSLKKPHFKIKKNRVVPLLILTIKVQILFSRTKISFNLANNAEEIRIEKVFKKRFQIGNAMYNFGPKFEKKT